MPTGSLRDAWLLPTLEAMLGSAAATRLRAEAVGSYWESAVRGGLARDEEILAAAARRLRIPVADLAASDGDAAALVPAVWARRYGVLPIAATDAVLEIATAAPYDLDCERALEFATGRTVRMALAAPRRLARRIEEVYGPGDAASVRPAQRRAVNEGRGDEPAAPIVRLVDEILAEAIACRASDVHLETEEEGVALRFRVDGVLRHVRTFEAETAAPLVSRIKIMSGLDIADRLRPQDGRARLAVHGASVDLRISTLPAAHGEKVVIRILDTRATVLQLESLGFDADAMARMHRLLDARDGIILVTGPTGSGKTTTLYSALRRIQRRGVNIVTVEDPIEYRLPGIVQVQVNERTGLTFAAALRSIMRQDPDVVLIGEIRDHQTASIAIQAALTGHLVLSTLHTIDAVSAVMRLVDIGVDRYKIASAMKGVVAQRLVRRLCRACREAAPAPERVRAWLAPAAPTFVARGCESCAATGYHGRLAVVEVLLWSAQLERLVAGGAPGDRLVQVTRAEGARSLWASGVAHVEAGETSAEELLRVLEAPSGPPPSGSSLAPGRGAAPGSSPEQQARGSAAAGLGDGAPAADLATGPSVVVAQQEGANRAALLAALAEAGLVAVAVDDAGTLLDACERHPPDVVVLGLDLSGAAGLELLRQLRALLGRSYLVHVARAGEEREELEAPAFDAGADDVLVPPLRPRALAARLQALLRRGRFRLD